MPEALQDFIEKNDFGRSATIQQSILSTYEDDFSKYAARATLSRLQRVFRQAPREVGRKVKYSRFSREDEARHVREAIDLLCRANVIAKVHHSHSTGVPLDAESDERTFKLLFLDIGLVNRALGLDWLAIGSREERSLVNEGNLAEQFVGQELLRLQETGMPPRLHYWLRERKSGNAEVDYVVSRGDLVVPVEVKSGKSGSLKSILQFAHDRNAGLAVRFDLNPASFCWVEHSLRQNEGLRDVELRLMSLPLYMVGQACRLIDLYRGGAISATRDRGPAGPCR
jgi:predicted AAA+ superfamily ATPase